MHLAGCDFVCCIYSRYVLQLLEIGLIRWPHTWTTSVRTAAVPIYYYCTAV